MVLKRKAQSTVELGVFSIILFMVLSFLFQQGYLMEQKQKLQMYTHRQAMKFSQQQNRRINLTVMRSVSAPNFFGGLERIPIVATASAEWNPRYEWISQSTEDQPDGAPDDTPEVSYLQIGDEMMQSGDYVTVPLMKMRITANGEDKVDFQPVGFMDQTEEVITTAQTTKRLNEDNSTIRNYSEQDYVVERFVKYHVLLPDAQEESIDKIEGDLVGGDITAVTIESIPETMDVTTRERVIRTKEWETRK